VGMNLGLALVERDVADQVAPQAQFEPGG
jgi:hypothetical protein